MKSSFPTMVVPLTLHHLKNKHKHIKKYSKENGRVFFYLFIYKIKTYLGQNKYKNKGKKC